MGTKTASRRHVRRLISGAYGAHPRLQIMSLAGTYRYSPSEYQSNEDECLVPVVEHCGVVLHFRQGLALTTVLGERDGIYNHRDPATAALVADCIGTVPAQKFSRHRV